MNEVNSDPRVGYVARLQDAWREQPESQSRTIAEGLKRAKSHRAAVREIDNEPDPREAMVAELSNAWRHNQKGA